MTLLINRSHWRKAKFGSVIDSITDRVDNPSESGVERYVGLEHLDTGSMTISRWGTPDQVEATKLLFKNGDVIFGRRRAYQKKVSMAEFDGICSAHALVLRGKTGQIDPLFLPVFLSSNTFLERAIKISVGSLSPTVNWKTLALQEFMFPPIEQQKKIANLLWLIDHHKKNLQNLNLDLNQLRNLFIESAFNGSTNLPGKNPKSFMSLGGCAIVLRGEAITKKEVSLGDVPVVAGGMNPAYFHNVSNRTGKCITISASGANAGFINTWEIPIWASDCTTVQTKVPAEFSFDYIHAFLISQQETIYKRLRKGSAQPHVYSSEIEKLQIPILDPSEQRAITAVNSRYSEAIHGIEQEIFALSVLFTSILDSIFGEV